MWCIVEKNDDYLGICTYGYDVSWQQVFTGHLVPLLASIHLLTQGRKSSEFSIYMCIKNILEKTKKKTHWIDLCIRKGTRQHPCRP